VSRDPIDSLRRAALRLAETSEGVACKGMVLETPTVQVRGKAFVFLDPKAVRMKLSDSIPEATRLAAKDPARYRVGSGGWTTVSIADGDAEAMACLERWMVESHRLLAPRSLARGSPPKRKPATSAKRRPTSQGGKRKPSSR
jgi:hypothetical protein